MDMKILVVTDGTDEYDKIESVLKPVSKEIKREEFDNEALTAMNLMTFDIIVVYGKANLILKKDFFINKMQTYIPHIPPVVVLVDEADGRFIKSISASKGIDFCLAFDFSKEVLIELFHDCIYTAIDLSGRSKHLPV